ncbi:MAG TPA: NAD(P)/FAD-dependent oxidoreductase [Aquabacterium sp.]|uniref:flavin-containing monooxygenase n=1 Tax=Aquabacterium sp. TaxID=1872578 RepID=UPI002E3302E0|nr:NAD(P)/FAD-dependent oxidoreductase [Aquabacterium sp.]HEX5372983.1 NAD(P)/FAD-dependent oxidoreductase [Aquabacterium sp.]
MTVQSVSSSGPVREVEVAIAGAGFGGLCMAVQLQKHGINDFLILEKKGEVGGAWRDNHYPGAACDVQSHMYSYSWELKADWSKRYAPWHEIQQYILDVVKKYDLRRHIHFNQEVVSAVFNEGTGRWVIKTAGGETIMARHWVLASGPLHVPAIPNIKGLKDFKGKVMHSAEWDHGYDLTGKKVASIGTGGSAIQYVPEIAPKVGKLHVFQRTAAWVIPRDERKYSEFRKKMFAALPFTRTLHRWRCYWTNESRVWPIFNPWLAKIGEAGLKKFIAYQVKDPELRKKLTPDYTLGCKRILISNKWFPTFNRENVELVTDDLREITADGIITKDGKERKVDCIILGTGFIVDPRIYMKSFELRGLNGHTVQEDWKVSPTSYLGITTSNYPNMYQLVGPHTGLGHNSIIFMIEAQVDYIIKCMQLVKAKGADYIDVKPQAMTRFLGEVTEALKGTVWNSGCKSWYQTADGINFAIWPKSTWKYWLETRTVNEGDYVFGKASAKGASRGASSGGSGLSGLPGEQAMARVAQR